MTGTSLLPVAIHHNTLYFLFGRDTGDTPGFACFGGGIEKHETNIYKAALREGAEELTGFLGNAKQLETLIQTNGGHFPITHQSKHGSYHAHIFRIPYEPLLPLFYQQNHDFLIQTMTQKHLFENKHLFEKAEIAWMTPQDMKKRRSEFRPFYQNIVDQIFETLPSIQQFLKNTPPPVFSTSPMSTVLHKKHRKSRKHKFPL